MRLKKKGKRIVALDNEELFSHCAGGGSSIHESEFPRVYKILMGHNVDIVNLIMDNVDVEEEEETGFDVSQIGQNF